MNLRSLIASAEGTSVSMFMPVEQEPDKQQKNRIRFQNLLREGQRQLEERGFRQSDIDRLLAPAEGLIAGGRFLATQGSGLALFVTEEFARSYQLPQPFEELVAVGRQFFIKPLIPLLTDGYFYIVALSQSEVRLLRGTQYRVERVELRDMPAGLEEALQWDDPERQLQWHTSTGAQSDGRSAVFHGHGTASQDSRKDDLLRYFRLIDRGLRDVLADEDAPVVLAGVDYLLPIFKEANNYPHLLDEGITGNPEHWSDQELLDRAWPIVQPYFGQAREKAMSKFNQLAGSELVSDDVTQVVPSAYLGRVDTLFVAVDQYRWGEFDVEKGHQVIVRPEAQPGDEELLNVAAIHTLTNGGTVYALPSSKMPEDTTVAAIYRF